VGLRKDLREDPIALEELRSKSQDFVNSREASERARTIKARQYLECSSLTREGVEDVFEAATRASLLTHNKEDPSNVVFYCENTR
jgi:Rho family, other